MTGATLGLLSVVAALVQTSDPSPRVVSFCELLEHRVEYNGLIVKVRGEVKAGGHGPSLTAPSTCDYRLVTRAVTWPNVIFLTYPNNQSPVPEDHAGFRVDWKSIRSAEQSVRLSNFDLNTDHLFETYVGRFVTHPDLGSRVNPPSLGGTRLGFGPIGLDAPAQLVIESVSEVSIVHGKPGARVIP